MQAVYPAVTFWNLNPFNEKTAKQKLNLTIENIDKGKCFLETDPVAFATCINIASTNSGIIIMEIFIHSIMEIIQLNY